MPFKIDTIETDNLSVNGAEFSRKIILLPIPTSGETVSIDLSSPETIIKFDGDLAQAFNLDAVTDNSKLGDKLFLIVSSTIGNFDITSTGNLNFNACGPDSPPSTHEVEVGTTIIPFMFDGNRFYGLDYC
jgi:hypothetical protein